MGLVAAALCALTAGVALGESPAKWPVAAMFAVMTAAAVAATVKIIKEESDE